MTSTESSAIGRRRTLAGIATLTALSAGGTAARAQTGQASAVTAVDIALEPDDVMIQHAKAANARLRRDFPKGFALDATHHPHVTMLQQFVRTADLDQVYAAAGRVFVEEKPLSWKLKAFKYYYIPSPITTFRRRRLASRASSSSRHPICCACNRSSSRRSPPSPRRTAHRRHS
jgi:hypothetical protein